MKMWTWNKVPVAALTVLGLSVGLAGYPNATKAAGATNAVPTSIIAPSRVNLPPVPAKVLQMAEAGVSDELILSYIRKSADSYALDAEQIIYLHDLGVSSAVLNALVEHEGTMINSSPTEISGETADAQSVSSTAAATDQSTPPVSGSAADFYDALAPYGTWVDVPAYGWCWQPTVVVVNPAWLPYCNNGCWLWTDQGWYWNSYYSWGWAPFHYGRWCRYRGYGWLWRPDQVWGPAWVCWRNYPGYCGWAPLPPGASFTAGVGWTFNGLAVGFNFGFGLRANCFTFCDYDHFCHRHPFDHFRHGHDADRFFHHSRVDNGFALDAHHHFINRGIGLSHIEAATHTRIEPVAVHEFRHGAEHSGDFTMPDRLARYGNHRVIYRPGRDLSVMRNHFQHHTPVSYRINERATHRFTTERAFNHSSGFHIVRPNNQRSSAPNIESHQFHFNTFSHNQRSIEAGHFRAHHFQPAQNFHRDFSASRRATPAWHRSAPISHSTPAWHPTQTRQATPAWHSVQVRHSMPAPSSTPAWHSSPSHHWNNETHVGGQMHSSHFGGGTASGHAFGHHDRRR